MQSDICFLTAKELIDAYKKKALSPVEVMKATLDQAEALNPHINSLFSIEPEVAIAEARKSEKRWNQNAPKGDLDGLPVTVKDSIRAEGFPYWRGCRAFIGTPLAKEDAPPAARLKEAGAIIFAKSTQPDLGMLVSGVSSAHGIVRNAWNKDYNTGGSSSGAASSVAAGITSCSIGSDIAGSVRLPAAHCGVFGFKPTNGRIPHIPPDPMRCVGPLSRTVADAALILNTLVRPDRRDYWALPPTRVNFYDNLTRDLKGLRIGMLLDIGFGPSVSEEVSRAVECATILFEEANAAVEPISLTFNFDPMEVIERFFMVRTYLEYNAFTEEQKHNALPYIRQWSTGAEEVSGVELMAAIATIEQIKGILMEAFNKFDYILSPVMPMVGFAADALGPNPDKPIAHIGFTCLYNQTRQPAASICCGFADNGLPIGLQIIGKQYDDLGVLQLAYYYEQRRGIDISWPIKVSAS
ncbi:MAG: amidase [Desulfobacterales bacterium]|nr:MAG: amidase [Desulfobacterales bacterium]